MVGDPHHLHAIGCCWLLFPWHHPSGFFLLILIYPQTRAWCSYCYYLQQVSLTLCWQWLPLPPLLFSPTFDNQLASQYLAGFCSSQCRPRSAQYALIHNSFITGTHPDVDQACTRSAACLIALSCCHLVLQGTLTLSLTADSGETLYGYSYILPQDLYNCRL